MAKEHTITVCDFETGGLSWKENPITEVGMLNFDAKTLEVNWEFQTYVKPYGGKVINPIVYEKTTVTPQDVENGMEVELVVKEITRHLKDAKRPGRGNSGATIFSGHNFSGFDIHFYLEMMNVVGKKPYEHLSTEIMDTLPMSRMFWANDNIDKYNLGACCKRIGYDLVGAHGAMADVRANFELLKHLIQNNNNNGLASVKSVVRKEGGKHRNYFNF
jgi:DNA polymerase III epsilon subunit-like protein